MAHRTWKQRFDLIAYWFSMGLMLSPVSAIAADYVIHISIDGLNSEMMQRVIDAGDAPTLKRFQDESAWTANARTDFTHTVTLPNHTCMITGRPTLQPEGKPPTVHHGYVENDAPARRSTLHNSGNTNVDYIASTFDVVHDAGLSTAMYASKDKFIIYDQTYDANHGAEHENGRDKIDVYYFQNDGPPEYAAGMQRQFLADMAARRFNYVFVHYADTDMTGHKSGWGGSAWNHSLKTIDGYLADVVRLVESDPKLAGKTAILVTTDHGGIDLDHAEPERSVNYMIPVFVWGAGVGQGDLYEMNRAARTDPGESRPDYNAPEQPIRNGDTGNLALRLLRLGPIPGSTINVEQDLCVALAGDYNLDGKVSAADQTIWRDTLGSSKDLRADGDGNGVVEEADFEIWKQNYGVKAN